jgi:hypothetical protein
MQILSTITVAADSVKWPASFSMFTTSLGVVNLNLAGMLPIAGCTFILPNHVQLALHLATPIASVFMIKLAAFMATACSVKTSRIRRRLQRDFVDKIILHLLLLFYPSISQRVFQSFRCIQVGDPELGDFYLEADMSVRCWESTSHAAYTAVSTCFIVFFLAGVPLLLFWELWRHRAHLHDTTSARHLHVKNRLGFVYEEFEPGMWFFSICVILVKW